MAVSRRLRFEILRRDNHTCRYCGRSAPEVKLTVDHVVPTALGGTDDPSNLVTACADCNGGKSANSPTETVVAEVAQDALRWSAAIKAVSDQRSADRSGQEEAVRRFRDNWMFQYERHHHSMCTDHADDWCPFELPANYGATVGELLTAGLTTDDLVEAVKQAWGQDFRIRSYWKYFCGVAWGMVKAQLDAARELIAGGSVDGVDEPAVFRFPYREVFEVVLDFYADERERAETMAAILRVEDLWQRRVLWGLESGKHGGRAQREALDSTIHDINCDVEKIFQKIAGEARAAKFLADMAARSSAGS